MKEIRLRAYAKVNLGLDVLRRRPDGYHDVRMIMQNIDLFDKVSIKKSMEGKISMRTNVAYLPTDENNLVYKAAKLIIDEFNIDSGVFIDLYKFIPVAAGMAGGSADAAAVLVGMNELFGLELTLQQLMDRGVKLGADIPFCLMGGTVLAEGIGEKLTRLKDCPECYFVVAKPPFGVSTKYVYENLVLDDNTKHPDIDGILDAIANDSREGVAVLLENVLETVTAQAYPDIEEIKSVMKNNGALGSIMSGSGPTVFGMFADRETAEACNMLLRRNPKVKTSYVAGTAGKGVVVC